MIFSVKSMSHNKSFFCKSGKTVSITHGVLNNHFLITWSITPRFRSTTFSHRRFQLRHFFIWRIPSCNSKNGSDSKNVWSSGLKIEPFACKLQETPGTPWFCQIVHSGPAATLRTLSVLRQTFSEKRRNWLKPSSFHSVFYTGFTGVFRFLSKTDFFVFPATVTRLGPWGFLGKRTRRKDDFHIHIEKNWQRVLAKVWGISTPEYGAIIFEKEGPSRQDCPLNIWQKVLWVSKLLFST